MPYGKGTYGTTRGRPPGKRIVAVKNKKGNKKENKKVSGKRIA
jgi:hypothetical protein